MRFFLLLSFLFLAKGSFALIRTVSNDPQIPAQYTSAQEAVNSANSGDSIYVTGSVQGYGTLNIDKKIALFGNGLNKFNGTKLSFFDNIFIFSNSPGAADGVLLSGITVTNIVCGRNSSYSSSSYQFGVKNIQIIRCFIGGGVSAYSSNPELSEVSILQSVFHGQNYNRISFNRFNSVLVSNCSFFFCSGIEGGEQYGSYFVNNCQFIGSKDYYNCATLSGVRNVVFQNSIFSNVVFENNFTSTTFNKCVTYGCNDNSIASAGIVKNSCLLDQSPDFLKYPAEVTRFSNPVDIYNPSYCNLLFSSSSVCLGSGLDGTNIGPTGGSFPLNYSLQSNALLPRMQQIIILNGQTISSQGGTLQVQFKAKKGN